MMHQTFRTFPQNRDNVDRIIREASNGNVNFSTVFQHLFPPNGNYSNNMMSYLNLLHEFEFNGFEQLLQEQRVVYFLYQTFQIEQHGRDGVYQFWVFLLKMHETLVKTMFNRPNFDNSFAFMNGFPIENTRVVIIGRDPSPKYESSGYAFHGSDCQATYNLVGHFFNNDPLFLENARQNGGGGPEPLQAPFAKKIFNLESWVNQGVLLFNTYPTFGEHSQNLWLNFTRFLVKQLSSECDCLVFILACKVAHNEFPDLINREKHEVIKVYHPTHPIQNQTEEDLKWNIQRPFHQANAYFGEKGIPLIDWGTVRDAI